MMLRKWLVLVPLILTVGCDDGDVNGADPDEARQAITAAFGHLNSCLVDLRDSAGMQAVLDFVLLRDGYAESEDWVEDLATKLAEALALESIEDSRRYDFYAHAGTYTWSYLLNQWSASGEPTDAIVLSFPARETSSVNNAAVTLSNYADTTVQLDGELYGAPTSLNMSAEVDDAEVMSFDGAVTYNMTGLPLPTLADISIGVAPFALDLAYRRPTDTRFTASLTFGTGGTCDLAANAEVNLVHADYETIEGARDFDNVSLTLRIDDVALEIVADVDELADIEEPSAAQINRYVSAQIVQGNTKLADVVVTRVDYEWGDLEELTIRIVFSDESRDAFEVYTDPFAEQVEEDFAEYF